MDNRTPLRKAVDSLIADGKIKQDKDLQAIFKKSKSTISAYLTGKPGKQFLIEFQKHFGLDIKKFEESSKISALNEDGIDYQKINSKPVTEEDVIKRLENHIKDLQATNAWIKKLYEEQKDKTDANLMTALENQKFQIRQLAVISRLQAEYYADGDAKKFATELDKIDKLVTAGM